MFYERFCQFCVKKGKAPSVCAEEIGLHKSQVTRWKKGAIPRDTSLIKIAEYFGCSVSELLGEEEHEENKEQPVPAQTEDGLSYIQKLLIAEIPNMDDDEVSTLLILAKQLSRRKQPNGSGE